MNALRAWLVDRVLGPQCHLCPERFRGWRTLLRPPPPRPCRRPPMKLCQVEGCERKHNAHGLCTTHEQRMARGIPLDAPPQNVGASFERQIQKGPGCWEWQGYIASHGYGTYRKGYAHREAYVRYVGPIPEGMVLDHLCRNRACVNPAHLEPVTNKLNILRGASVSARNAVKTHCTNGHEFTEDNTYRRPDTGTRQCRACWRLRRTRKSA